MYIPAGIIAGLPVAKDAEAPYHIRFKRMVIAYVVCEIIITLFIYPLTGISIEEQMGGKTGKYALSCFIFMIDVVAFLET